MSEFPVPLAQTSRDPATQPKPGNSAAGEVGAENQQPAERTPLHMVLLWGLSGLAVIGGVCNTIWPDRVTEKTLSYLFAAGVLAVLTRVREISFGGVKAVLDPATREAFLEEARVAIVERAKEEVVIPVERALRRNLRIGQGIGKAPAPVPPRLAPPTATLNVGAGDSSGTRPLSASSVRPVASPFDPDDPTKGTFGGKSEDDRYRLRATVTEDEEDDDWYEITATVESKNPSRPLRGKVRFHLHPTFQRQTVVVTAKNGCATLTRYAYGAFTLGVEVLGEESASVRGGPALARLELDLAKIENAPEEFKRN